VLLATRKWEGSGPAGSAISLRREHKSLLLPGATDTGMLVGSPDLANRE